MADNDMTLQKKFSRKKIIDYVVELIRKKLPDKKIIIGNLNTMKQLCKKIKIYYIQQKFYFHIFI